jgi:hypothetical protein
MKVLFSIIVIAVLGSCVMQAQSLSDMNVFGYFQARLQHNVPAEQKVNSSYSLDQLNLFFAKDFTPKLSGFVSLELTNSFSSDMGWGSFNLAEAWVKYSPSAAFNVQAGLLVPEFNNLNEIKNKTPLLPYVFRPLVYEATISSILDIGAYLPERAFVQVKGSVPVGDIRFDYAAHVGNSEKRYITTSQVGTWVPGQDTTSFKSVGGRVGIRWSGLKAGVSYTYDRDKQSDLMLGDVPRTRLGFDLSIALAGFTMEGEYIGVNDHMNVTEQATLSMISTMNPLVNNSLKKTFYYGNVMYDFTDAFYGYGGYSYLDDKSNQILSNGVASYTAGVGYKVTEAIVVKAQWAHFKMNDQTYFTLDQNTYFLAVSVFF